MAGAPFASPIKNLLWSFGVGIGLTRTGNRFIYKFRLEYSFGHKCTSADGC